MACQSRKNTASRHYDLQWRNIIWILLLLPPSHPHITGSSSLISKVSLHWISGRSWQGEERIGPCHDGMTSEKNRQVVIMTTSEQTLSEFLWCRRPLVPILQGHPHQYLRWVSIEFQANHGKGGSALGRVMMACRLRKIMASHHYDLQWTNIVWILLLPPPSCPHITEPSSPISKVSLHWISGQSWQGRGRIEPCHNGISIEIKYGKMSLWSEVNKYCLIFSAAATLSSPYYRAILTNI